MTHLLLQTDTIQTIPVLTLTPETADSAPAVFFIPGFGNRKESGLNLGYQLAQKGFFFVSFDPWLHGERHDNWLVEAATPKRGGIYPPETGLDTGFLFYCILHRCLLDVQTLLAHYAPDKRVDVNRCGVTGVSMGGYASFLLFANLPQLKTAVPMIGLPTFTRRWLDVLDECAFSNPVWAAALEKVTEQTRQRTAFIQSIDPLERLKQGAPRPLLIMNNDFDFDQPKLYSIEAYRELRPYYTTHPDNLKLNIYPAGHIITPEMEQDVVAWFCQRLLDLRGF